MTFKKWRDKGESLRVLVVDRYKCIALAAEVAADCVSLSNHVHKHHVTKTKTALKQETYNLSDLKVTFTAGLSNLATR